MTDSQTENWMQDTWNRERLAQVRSAIGRYCGEALSFVAECPSNPAPGSRLAADAVNRDARTTFALAAWFLTSGIDHLWALMFTLHPSQAPLAGCFTLARASIEASARAAWLLEENITLNQRIARGLVERVYSVESQNKVFPDDSWLAGRIQSIRTAADRNGIQVRNTKNTGRPVGFDQEQRPSATHIIEEQLRACFGTTTPQHWLFGLLSAYSHSTNFALVLNAETIPEDAAGWGRGMLRRRRDWIGGSAHIASTFHAFAVNQLARLAERHDSPEFLLDPAPL